VSSAQIFNVADGSTTAGGLVGTTGAVVGATTAVVGCTTGAAGVAAGVPHALSASESTRTDTIIKNKFFFIFILQTLIIIYHVRKIRRVHHLIIEYSC